MSKMFVFTVVRTEKDGKETTVFSRFLDDIADKEKEMAAIGFEITKGKEPSDMTIKIKGSLYPSMIGAGQAITFKIEEAA